MKVFTAIILGFFLLSFVSCVPNLEQEVVRCSFSGLYSHRSIRNFLIDAVVVSDNDPYLGLISTSVACWYDKETNTTGILPLLVHHRGNLTDSQTRFLETFFNSSEKRLLVLGEPLM